MIYISIYYTLGSGLWLGTGIAQVCAYFPSGGQGEIYYTRVQCLAILHNQECNERFIIYRYYIKLIMQSGTVSGKKLTTFIGMNSKTNLVSWLQYTSQLTTECPLHFQYIYILVMEWCSWFEILITLPFVFYRAMFTLIRMEYEEAEGSLFIN